MLNLRQAAGWSNESALTLPSISGAIEFTF